MAVHKLAGNIEFYLNQYRVTTHHSAVTIERGCEALDATNLANTTRVNLGGLQTVTVNGEGFLSYGSGDIESQLSTALGTTGNVMTIGVEGADAVGDPAVFLKTFVQQFKPLGGTVGDLHKFAWAGGASKSPCVEGKLFVVAGNKTSSSNSGTGIQLGAVSASQRVYAALHVLSASGTSPTLDVTVRSDNASGFPSAATQITFTQATAATSEFKSAAGAITDDYWRVDWTIGGSSTPTFSFVVAVGIL